MKMTTRTLLALALCLAAASPASAIGPCDSSQPESGVPIRIPLGPADLGMPGEVCAGTSVALDTRMRLTIATEEFYGSMFVGAALRARMQIGEIAFLSAVVPGFEYRFVANATIEASGADLGAVSIGAQVVFMLGDWFQVTSHLRVLLPTETVYVEATRLGFDLGATTLFRAHEDVEVLVGAAFPITAVYLGSKQETTFVPNLTVDLTWRATSWLAVAAGLGIRFAPQEDEAFESLDPRLGLRFYAFDHLLIELTGAMPVAGRDRTDGAAFFSVGWVFEEGPFAIKMPGE